MKNKTNIFLVIIGIILLGLLAFGIIKYLDYNKLSNNEINGYYKLEKIISYYKIDNKDNEKETTEFFNEKKLYINNEKIEAKILDESSYYYLLKDGIIYYSLNEIDKENLINEKNFEYEKNNDYLILVQRGDITNTYYYKIITAGEY